MLAEKAFFSFTTIIDPANHAPYNEWHQLDHRPENLLLEGVRYGERWVLSPDCAALNTGDHAELARTHYINLYWYREPVAASMAEWQGLAERSFQWGRRPDTEWATRPLMGFFTTVKGYVSPRVKVSADALPFRPNRGVHVTVASLREPYTAKTEQLFSWYDSVRIPALLEQPGVAGAWTYSSDSTTLDPTWQPAAGSNTFNAAGSDHGFIRVTVVFLDEEPTSTCASWTNPDVKGSLPTNAASSDLETILFSAPLRFITPWEWGWFDQAG